MRSVGEVELTKSKCIEDFVAILLSNDYSVFLENIANNKIKITIKKGVKNYEKN